jgi:hypothetical protein
LTASIIAFFFYLASSLGFSFSADNIGDSFEDMYRAQDSTTQAYMDLFMHNPQNAIFLTSAGSGMILTSDIYNMVMDMQANGVSASQLNSMGLDMQAWLGAHENDINVSKVGTYGYKVSNALGQSVVFDWKEERDSLDRKCWVFHQFVYDENGKLISDITTHSGSSYSVYDENRVKSIVQNSFYSSEGFYFQVVDNYWSFSIRLSDYIDTDVGVTDEPVIGEEDKPIGTVYIDGEPYYLNPDGSVTYNGVTYYPNSDGTITINNQAYDPRYDFTSYNNPALMDLLNYLIQLINDLENQLTYEEDNAYDGATSSSVAYEGELSEFIYNGSWATIFPFCIPWDFVRGVKLLSAKPEAPRFEIPFEVPKFGLFNGYSTVIVLDFSTYTKYFYVVRWFTTVCFIGGLCFITFKIVKGAT